MRALEHWNWTLALIGAKIQTSNFASFKIFPFCFCVKLDLIGSDPSCNVHVLYVCALKLQLWIGIHPEGVVPLLWRGHQKDYERTMGQKLNICHKILIFYKLKNLDFHTKMCNLKEKNQWFLFEFSRQKSKKIDFV